MTQEYKINLPINIPQSKTKNFTLNLNQYRNTHYQTLNAVKERFTKLVKDRVAILPAMAKVSVKYTLFTGSNHLSDIMNFICIVDKFFCDSLVHYKKLPDDNYNHLISVSGTFGGIDKSNPRVEATLYDIELEEPMKIIVTSQEITNLIDNYIRVSLNLKTDQEFSYSGQFADTEVVLGPKTDTAQATQAVQAVPARIATTEPTKEEAPVEASKGEPAATVVGASTTTVENSGLGEQLDNVPPKTSIFATSPEAAQTDALVKATTPAPTSVNTPKSLFAGLEKPVNPK